MVIFIAKDFSRIVMSSEKDNILEFNQCMKSDKISFIIYADIESLIRKTDGCANNPEKSSTTKIGDHIPCGYSMSTIWGFDHIEDKHTLYRGKDCMEKFCTSLREHAKNIVDFVTVNKRRIKITSRCKSTLSLWKKNSKKKFLKI